MGILAQPCCVQQRDPLPRVVLAIHGVDQCRRRLPAPVRTSAAADPVAITQHAGQYEGIEDSSLNRH